MIEASLAIVAFIPVSVSGGLLVLAVFPAIEARQWRKRMHESIAALVATVAVSLATVPGVFWYISSYTSLPFRNLSQFLDLALGTMVYVLVLVTVPTLLWIGSRRFRIT